MNFDIMNLMAELSAFHTESTKIAGLIRTIEKYFDTIYDGSTKSEGYVNFKEAIMDIEEEIASAEAQRLENFRNQYESMK